MDRLAVVSALGLLLLYAVPGDTAEGAMGLLPGARVRVLAPEFAPKPIVGTVESSSGQRIVLRVENRDPPVVVPFAEITRLDLSRGRARGKSALIGAAIGGALAAGSMMILCQGGGDCDTTAVAAVYGAGGLVLGGGVGAIVGAERWEDVPSDRIRVSLAPTPGRGVSVRFAVSFP
jgi:hypothetical protein